MFAVTCHCLSFFVWSCFALETDSDSQRQTGTDKGRQGTQRQTETCRDRQRRTETAQRIIRNTDKEFPHVPHAVAWGCNNLGTSAWFMPLVRACCWCILLVPPGRASSSHLLFSSFLRGFESCFLCRPQCMTI